MNVVAPANSPLGEPQYSSPRHGQQRRYENYNAEQSEVTGIGRLFLAGVIIVLCSVYIPLELDSLSYLPIVAIGGYIASILCVLSGSFGITASQHKYKCMVNAEMVLSIVSALAGPAILWTLLAKDLIVIWNSSAWGGNKDSDLIGLIVIDALMFSVSVTQLVLDIWAAILCLRAFCTGSATTVVSILEVRHQPDIKSGESTSVTQL